MNLNLLHLQPQSEGVAQILNQLWNLDIPDNPKGIASLSLGLRGTSYSGCAVEGVGNLEGVGSSGTCTLAHPMAWRRERIDRDGDATLTGLVVLPALEPRVARASQPWAERFHPFRMTAEETRAVCLARL